MPARARALHAGRLRRRAPRARLRQRGLQRGDAAVALPHLRARVFASLALPGLILPSRAHAAI